MFNYNVTEAFLYNTPEKILNLNLKDRLHRHLI